MESPIKVFSNWVLSGKDEGMERNHSASVKNMIEYSTKGIGNYSFIDAGCGNGWVIRGISSDPRCKQAIGIDGSAHMIEKAKKLDSKNQYYCKDLLEWSPDDKGDIVHSMEVFYYFENPDHLIKHVYSNWIKKGGRLIMGIDHYEENKPSHSWKQDCCVTIMKLFSENKWKSMFEEAGFKKIESWCHGKDGDWNGTLVVTGVK